MKDAIEFARKWISTWPAWKRNILRNSGKSTTPIPRKPVSNK